MKNSFLLISLFTISGTLTALENQPVHSAATIIKCTGQIPNKTACLIEANSLKINIYRIDIRW